MWKIVGVSEASIIYIYIDNTSHMLLLFLFKNKFKIFGNKTPHSSCYKSSQIVDLCQKEKISPPMHTTKTTHFSRNLANFVTSTVLPPRM